MKKVIFAALCCSVFFVMPAFANETSVEVGNSVTQGQASENTNNNNPNFSNDLTLISEGSTPKRGVHVPPVVNFPGLVADITGPANHFGPNFTRMVDLLKYKSGKINEVAFFTREELQPIVDATETFLWFGDEPDVRLRCFGGEKLEKADRIAVTFLPLLFKKDGTVAFGNSQNNFDPKGYFHAIASADDHVSLDILAVALVRAMNKGINAVDIMSEGANRELYANGWGIGVNTSGASVNDLKGSAVSGVAGGGTGWSSSTSGFHQLPWIQGHLGYRSDM